jgi:quinohemoprotein ethanol dehydrogenase
LLAIIALRAIAADIPANVTQQRLLSADREPGNWMAPGRTWDEQRFSPLKQINDSNVSRLGVAWFADLATYRGEESSPIEIDGVLYNISAWDITSAYDAQTGKVLWRYDPQIAVEWARNACCGTVSRGLAAWHGKIIIGTLDGRLIALDARNGKPVWSTQTLLPGEPLSITGAPRVYDGVVVIGNGGGDSARAGTCRLTTPIPAPSPGVFS